MNIVQLTFLLSYCFLLNVLICKWNYLQWNCKLLTYVDHCDFGASVDRLGYICKSRGVWSNDFSFILMVSNSSSLSHLGFLLLFVQLLHEVTLRSFTLKKLGERTCLLITRIAHIVPPWEHDLWTLFFLWSD